MSEAYDTIRSPTRKGNEVKMNAETKDDLRAVGKVAGVWVAIQALWFAVVVSTLTALDLTPTLGQLFILGGLPYFVGWVAIMVDLFRRK